MRYCVLYPNTKNVNLVKEMGMIPYKLHKLFEYDSKIACYNLDDYTYLKEEVKGLKIDFVEKKYNNYSADGVAYLKRKAKDIDILQIFHVTLYSVCYAFMYKKLNPKGKIYLKLDCSHKLIERIQSLNKIEYLFLNKYLDKVDLISAEQKVLFKELQKLLPKQKHKFINIPNGVDYEYLKNKNVNYDYKRKENIILSVTRVGAEEKNTEMLLEAFSKINNIESLGWKLRIVGPIEEGFKEHIKNFYFKNPKMKNIIEFTGEINDREKLFREYEKSKIFSLTSKFESFGIAFVEAASLGNVIVSTDVGIARELINEGNGVVVRIGEAEELCKKLEEYILCEDLEKYSLATYKICKENFHWDKIITYLNTAIKESFYEE